MDKGQIFQILPNPYRASTNFAYRLLPLHWLDEAAGVALSLKFLSLRIFPEGLGATPNELRKLFSFEDIPKIPSIKIRWLKEESTRSNGFSEGLFVVPESQHLPESIRNAHFCFIPPPRKNKKVCLILAGWGEHGYNLRMRLAHALNKFGIGALMLENPFHGKRSLPDRAGAPVTTVLELGHLARAAISEGRALLHFFKKEGYQTGISGFSMGGNFAAMIASIYPDALPTTLLATPHSAEIAFLKGVLRKGIHWETFSEIEDPEKTLSDLFQGVSLLKLNPPDGGRRAIQVAARHDRLVPPVFVEQLHLHWKGSELRWRPGGHISLWLFEIPAMARAIADSFK